MILYRDSLPYPEITTKCEAQKMLKAVESFMPRDKIR